MPERLSPAAFTPEWISAQRWFRSKQRPIAKVSEADRAPIPGTDAALLLLAVAYVDGGESDLYLVPSVPDGEPPDGAGVWRALAAAIAREATLPGQRGGFRCAATPALPRLVSVAELSAFAERRMRVEQTNTSIVLGGDRLVLKLYRHLEPGVNPDVEVSAFLTDVGFDGTPALAGSVAYEPPSSAPYAAAMLQELVPSSGDAWAVMLDALAHDPARAAAHARTIGRVTAELHAALAARPDAPGFPVRVAGAGDTAAWRASAERQLAAAVTAVSGPAHLRLVELAPRVAARLADAFGRATGEAAVTRIHGDYHLGQLLARPDGGFAVIDFEGEPARPLSERRAPASPLRDVAGMLRSLDYAARTGATRSGTGLDADGWLEDARGELLAGYGGIGSEAAPLLEAFELEKACYEIRYEANNRPEWLWLPLGALERMVARDE